MMDSKRFLISMTKNEMLSFFVNKIIEDGIKKCQEFKTSIDLKLYDGAIDFSQYKKDILEMLYKDERIADVMIDNELQIDMTFYTNYCPYFYDKVKKIQPKEESRILSDFYYYSNSRIYEEGCIAIRILIDDFTEKISHKKQEKIYNTYNILKKNMVEIGFIDKYIENNNETFLTLENNKEFKELLQIRINNLDKQYQEEEQEEL